MQNRKPLILILVIIWVGVSGFKPPKNSFPKNDILYSKYGGDVELMLREERRQDSLARPYLYKVEEKEEESKIGIDDESVILEKTEIMPKFENGEAGLQEYIKSATAFIPDTLVGKKATVLVKFYINTLGDAKDPKIIKTDNPSFDLQTIMLVDGMPKWIPAKFNGKDVNCYITLPIKYGQ